MLKRKIAFYIRLSDVDEAVKNGSQEESNSITSQRKLLYSFTQSREEFQDVEVLEYFDDGFSGTKFLDRINFQRMIKDAENGLFECIIVKDFSRFGRDYLEVGNYLEFVFPVMGIRFISVNDNYDSKQNFGATGGMDVAYKNLIYQLYSMDLSKKVKSARRTRNLNGEYTASFVCYGYKKDPADKHKLIVDEEPAEVVREIFSLVISGYSAMDIARLFNERKIPTRVHNQWRNGVKYVPVHKSKDYVWDNSEILDIIRNKQYTGILIQNRWEVVGFGDNKKMKKTKPEDWSIVEGAIPQIVSKEIFDKANKLIGYETSVSRSMKGRKKNLFVCPYCGRKLAYSSTYRPKLICKKRSLLTETICSNIFMLRSEAQDKVLGLVKEICRTLIEQHELQKADAEKCKEPGREKVIEELTTEHKRISDSIVTLYQAYRSGDYTKEEYVDVRKHNQELLADLEKQINSLKDAIEKRCDIDETEQTLYQCSMLDVYDGDILSNIIEKVYVYNDKDIEVVFKCDDLFREYCKSSGNKEIA